MKKTHILISLLAILFFVACANIGTPDGGPYDETPPRVTRTSPKFGAAHVKTRKIVLEFDENIKLDNPTAKVVVSPPQLNMPEVSGSGKKITVELVDTLVPNMTYTIDFADAIEDNNEGNPMGDYAFTFSTGEQLDTFQVSGHVLNAENLEPIKGMLVGLYTLDNDSAQVDSVLPDSAFRTRQFERISRTDGRGHFVIKGLARGHYRVFALQDQDQDYKFSQKSEMLAFTDRVVSPYARPDIRPDTVWHDSIHYDSIVLTPYTHFFPDDIVLLAFTEAGQPRAFLKSERPQLEKFTLYFTAPDDTLPRIEGLNFDDKDAFIVDASQGNDTITYWIRDSLIYNNDTLNFVMHFNATDTLGKLAPTQDTIRVISKMSYERLQKKKQEDWENYAKEYRKNYKKEQRAKRHDKSEDDKAAKGEDVAEAAVPPAQPTQTEPEPEQESGGTKSKKSKKKKKKQEDEDIPVPPMPEKFLEVKNSKTTLNPDNNFDFTFVEPVDTAFQECFHLFELIDTLKEERPFLIDRLEERLNAYRLYAEWQPESKYELVVDTGAFVNMYGVRSAGMKKTLSVKSLDSFSTLFVNLTGADASAIVQLINNSDKVVRSAVASDGKASFYFIEPGTYYLRMFYDRNGDGKWTTGDYDLQRQGEETFYYPGAFLLRALWDVSQAWNPTATPLPRQKPGAITKQKPDKEKQVKNRNAERQSKKKK